jgi:hypothetical protein
MTARMIQLMRRSPRLSQVVEDLFEGSQDYLTLKSRLISAAGGIFPELMLQSLFSTKATV